MSTWDQIKLHIENYYDGDVVITEPVAYVTVPDDDDIEDWADDQILPLTGTGRTEGNSAYFVTITEFSARPDLVGRKFEFGI